MLKGIDVIAKIKYELKHNLDFSKQSVQVPVRDLELLIQLAESNQYRLDLETAERIVQAEQNKCTCK